MHCRSAFSLLEVMIATALLSIFAGVTMSPVVEMHKQFSRYQQRTVASMGFLQFQLMLDHQLQQAGFHLEPSALPGWFIDSEGGLRIKQDSNKDGDTLDSRESLHYQFDSDQQAVLVRSGRGGFQVLLSNIERWELSYWEEAGLTPEATSCLYMELKESLTSYQHQAVLCP